MYRRPNIHKGNAAIKRLHNEKKKPFTEDLHSLYIYKFTAIQKVDGIKEQTLVNDL